MNKYNEEELERRIGYVFHNKKWITEALCHSSYTNEHHLGRLACNERLEFLGDAVLELVSSEFLYNNYPKMPEGSLSKLRAGLVCEVTLDYDAKALELGKFLKLGKGEEATGGRMRASIVSDAMEALIGAIYMDGGLEEAKKFICRFVLDDVENKKLFFDSKTSLQEMVQAATSKDTLTYVLLKEEGPPHARTFLTEVRLGSRVLGSGSGTSKKSSEQQAAYEAIRVLKEKGSRCI